MDILGISRFATLDLRSPKVTANLKSYLQKYLFSLKQAKNKSITLGYLNFVSSRKESMVPLDIDKGLQWRYVKQKPFRQI